MMKLYTSLTSPYGRIARIVRLEKGLADRIALHPVKTRGADNSYYAVNPSGRVPSLILNDGAVLEDSTLVCWFMDHLDGAPTLLPPEGMAGLEHRRIEATARSMFDGLSLWGREYLYREAEIRSATIIAHEQARALRLADVFEKAVQGKVLSGPLNMVQITLAFALHGRMIDHPQGFRWQDGRPNLRAWVERMGGYASIVETLPPPRN